MQHWTEFEPEDAVGLSPDVLAGIEKPLNEMGKECPWPWEPQQLVGAPMGQYHCTYCGAMVVAGVPHSDWRDFDAQYEMHVRRELHELSHSDDLISEYLSGILV